MKKIHSYYTLYAPVCQAQWLADTGHSARPFGLSRMPVVRDHLRRGVADDLLYELEIYALRR